MGFMRKCMLGAVVVFGSALILFVTPASAWWSGWYSPNFSGSYSPSAYRHGQWTDSSQGFGSEMKWNQTRADGVRRYSNNRQYLAAWCSFCYGYYTHDHTDMNGRLNNIGYASNFPNPKYDGDDDDGNRYIEELEVVVQDRNFPARDTSYYYYTWFTRMRTGSGVVQETPAISAWTWLPEEGSAYYTAYHDRYQSLSYYNSVIGPQSVTEAAVSSANYSQIYTQTIVNTGFPIIAREKDGSNLIHVSYDMASSSAEKVFDYASWVRNVPINALRSGGVEQALTVVTFNKPTASELVDAMLTNINSQSTAEVKQIKSVFVDQNNSDCNSNVWTVGVTVSEGQTYQDALSSIISMTEKFHVDLTQEDGSVSSSSLENATAPLALQPMGVVALTAWLPLDTVEKLNKNEAVFSADVSPSYLRMVTSNQMKTQSQSLDSNTSNMDAKFNEDTFSDSIVAEVSDLYSDLYLAQFGGADACSNDNKTDEAPRIFLPFVQK